MNKVEVKFGDWIQKGIDLYKDNLGTLIVANLLAFVVSVFSFFILAGPMSVGVILITLSLLDKKTPPPQVGDVFKGFNYFLPSFLFCLLFFVAMFVGLVILSIIPCIGQLIGMLYSYSLAALVMFSLFHIAERNMDAVSAIKASIETVKTNFWPFLGLSAVASIIGSLGAIACGIGVVVTLPMYYCIIAVAYREIAAAGAAQAS